MPKYIENYALHEEIGSGSYGRVYKAINNQDGKLYAVKVVPIQKFRENKKLEECTVKEINILSNIEHNKHIIRYYDMLKTNNNFYFIYEFCNEGTLDRLITPENPLTEPKTLQIFAQLLQAFKVLNKYNIMHRDLKPDNIFFHDGIVKLGDFGFCKDLQSADQMAKTMLGSPIYMAPEVLKGEVYSNKADIWSLGVVLYEMVFGRCPFMSNSIAKLIQVLATQQLTFPSEVSPFMNTLIRKMLTKDPLQRIGWLQLFMLKINSEGNVVKNQKQIESLDQEAHQSQETTNVPNFLRLNQPTRETREATSQQSINHTSPGKVYANEPMSCGFKKKNNSRQVSDVSTNYGADSKHDSLPAEHKKVLQGVKLTMDLIASKMNNHMGFSNLVMNQTLKILTDQHDNCRNADFKKLLFQQMKDLKKEQEVLNKKMFSYELKGSQDWKKYLRGKYFEDENTIALWYRMVCYLDGKACQSANMNSRNMIDSVKSILY